MLRAFKLCTDAMEMHEPGTNGATLAAIDSFDASFPGTNGAAVVLKPELVCDIV